MAPHRMLVVLLMLFVYVLGGTLGAGVGAGVVSNSRTAYLGYLVPGIMLLTVASGAEGTAISVAIDMSEGIIARFRTMAISRASVLTGHVVGSVIQSVLSVTVVAVLMGFRPTADPVAWFAAVGVVAMFAFALTWLSVAFGLVTKSPEAASNLPMFLMLPFLGSGFVPTRSMPAGLRWFAEYQPFTPVTETLRGLPMGTPIGDSAIMAIAWSAGIALLAYLWAKSLYKRNAAR